MRASWRAALAAAVVVPAAARANLPLAIGGDGPEVRKKQAAVCDGLLARHEASRKLDLVEGVLRWSCGDVPGVDGKDFGQEYCEYKPIANGRVIRSGLDIRQGDRVQCLFTGVFADVMKPKGQPENQAYAQELAAELAKPENLGQRPDAALTVMTLRSNTREAATALIQACGVAQEWGMFTEDHVRSAAAHVAERQRGRPLQPAQKGELERDIAACLVTEAAGGLPWRNSDTQICTRVLRVVTECKVKYGEVPPSGQVITTAVRPRKQPAGPMRVIRLPGFDGFSFTGWTRALPSGCRHAKVHGRQYPQLVICSLTAAEVAALKADPVWSRSPNAFCHDRFGENLVMEAPIRALEAKAQAGQKPDASSPFCKAYLGGGRR